ENCSAFHLQACEVSYRPSDRDDAPFHAHADFEARRAADKDRSAFHSRETASISSTGLSAGVAVNADQPGGHLGAHPVRGMARDLDGSTLHVCAQVHAGITGDANAATGHAPPDPFHLARVAANFQLVAVRSFDLEKII